MAKNAPQATKLPALAKRYIRNAKRNVQKAAEIIESAKADLDRSRPK